MGRNIRGRHHGNDQGVALVLVLWIIVLLSVIGVSHSRNVRIDMQIARNHLESAKARSLAESGLNRAIMELFNKDEENRWLFNGELNYLEFNDGLVQVMIRNTAGLVDINIASPEVLQTLLTMVDMDDRDRMALVDAILDWRDSDELKHLEGAEDTEYKIEGLPYGTPDHNFFSIGELRYVLGMETPIFNALSPYITVFSGLSDVNQSYAPEELSSLFAYTDIGGFTWKSSFEFEQGRGEDVENQAKQDTTPQGQVSKVFHVSVWATANSGAGAGLEVDVDTRRKSGANYTILSWQESSQR